MIGPGSPALDLVTPDWPAPAHVAAVSTTRAGGVSRGPFASLNLGATCGDDAEAVSRNRAILRAALDLPRAPAWLEQVHGSDVVRAEDVAAAPPRADACTATEPGRVCAVLTADCLPVLLCDREGRRIAAVHAGWRGLASGVLVNACRALAVPYGHLMAWLGPAIGPGAYEVGDDVHAAFTRTDPALATCFTPRGPRHPGKWMADLYAIARRQLALAGVDRVYGGTHCTHAEEHRFYSYRRSTPTGRMATLIWRRE